MTHALCRIEVAIEIYCLICATACALVREREEEVPDALSVCDATVVLPFTTHSADDYVWHIGELEDVGIVSVLLLYL